MQNRDLQQSSVDVSRFRQSAKLTTTTLQSTSSATTLMRLQVEQYIGKCHMHSNLYCRSATCNRTFILVFRRKPICGLNLERFAEPQPSHGPSSNSALRQDSESIALRFSVHPNQTRGPLESKHASSRSVPPTYLPFTGHQTCSTPR